MIESWLLLAIACSVFLGLYQITIKKAVHNNAVFPVTYVSTLFASLPVFIYFVLYRLLNETSDSLIPQSLSFHAVIFTKSLVVSASWVLGFKAIQQLPLSIASPLRESGLIWTLLGGVFLFQEVLSLAQITAIFFFFLAVGLLSSQRAEQDPLKKFGKVWIVTMLAATTCGSISSLMDKHILTNMRVTPLTLQCWFSIYNLLILSVLSLTLFRSSFKHFQMKKRIVFCGLVLFFADLLYYHSVHSQDGLISIISLIRRISFVSPVLFGIFFLNEKLSLMKTLALCGIFLAVILAIL